ncbi:MAG TPA: hypothetical protein VHT74_31625 [Acetobacteraceae bacterium]|jgi:hypothetical protein|nr:hypothetical protein [Acetobacteraceae bacterium]
MVRLAVLLVAMCLLVPVSRARAGEYPSICRAQSVLDVMAREIHKRDYYARIEPRLVDEVPEAAQNTVWCGVVVWSLRYDARFAVGVPLGLCEQHAFRVRALSNGYVVRYLR